MKTNRIIIFFLFFAVLVSSCKKDKDSPAPSGGSTGSSDAVLVIDNRGDNTTPGKTIPYSAKIVDKNGNVVPASSVSWSSSNTQVTTVSGSNVSTIGVGTATITATVTYNGTTLTASVPIGVAMPSVFDVLPEAIVYEKNGPDLQLVPVYIGTENPGTFTYTSSNSAVASVNAAGLVSFPGSGECTITVKATGLDGQPVVVIPVLVVGPITVPLPVTKIVVTPGISDIFKTETLTYTAKAYNIGGVEVPVAFTWLVSNDTVATIDSTGKVTGIHPGNTKVMASAMGMIGEADLTINPKQVIEITPFMASIAPSASRQFTATTYNVSKSNGNFVLTPTSNPADLKWEIPTYGISMFDIATINTSGLATVKSNATPGMPTFALAYSPSDMDIEGSAALIMVSDCDCGAGTGVTNIATDQPSYSISMFGGGSAQITATSTPAAQTLTFCSMDPGVLSVDQTGMVFGMSPGTGSIRICNGTTEKVVSVTVNP
ncbi:MAG: Ig domain-containing protein [Cytophagaceae bacterium]